MFNIELEKRISGSWKEKHKDTIEKILSEINKKSCAYVLKGGTSLMECYELTRFSEDIDLDSCDKEAIFEIIDSACEKLGYKYRIAKNTDTVIRFLIDYGGKDEHGDKPLKVEISYRRKIIPEEEITKINGITVYRLDSIALMKANAYASRDKIRDLYDVVFIVNHKKGEINPFVSEAIRTAMEQKGIEQFDYITSTQNDDLIDRDFLETEFLEAFDSLGLIADSGIREPIEDKKAKPVPQSNADAVGDNEIGRNEDKGEISPKKKKHVRR